jgi:sugar phosphate isomerase/epimerase
MYVSLNSSLTRNVPWPDFARLAAKVGYGGVDWGFSGPRAAGVDATRALFEELKIRPTIVNLPFQFSAAEDAYQQGLKGLDEAAKFAAAIGCTSMMQTLSPTSTEPKAERRKLIRDRLAEISDILGRSHIRLGIEFLGVEQFRTRPGAQEFIWKMSEAVDLAKDAGPNIGVVLDAWHWHHSGSTIADILAAGTSRIVHVHVSDAKAQPPEEVRDNQRLMPGEGVIDLIGFFQALKKIGYEGGVSPEPLGRVPAEMSAEDGAKLGLETTVAVMKRAGAV